MKKADKPELAKSVLEHSSVLPEEALVKKIQAGEMDVGFFYSVETTDAGLTAIDLPAGITPKAIYTVTILQNAPSPDGAQKFVSFLLGSKGSALLKEHGLSLTHPQLTGPETHAQQELQHALIISRQIDYLGKMPTVNPKPVKVSEDLKEMLGFDPDNENETIRNYRKRIRHVKRLANSPWHSKFGKFSKVALAYEQTIF